MILVIKRQRNWLNRVLVELISDELGYFTEMISKQSVKGVVWFLLDAYSKQREIT